MTLGMAEQRPWAARYQFLEELWRGRNRIVCDRELEAALSAGLEGPLAELLDRLLPGSGRGRTWMALHNDRRAVSFARSRAGTIFTGLDDAAEIGADEPWQVALISLADGETAEPAPALEAFFDVLGERVEEDGERSVVITLAVGEDEDRSYEALADLVDEVFGDARIYGRTRPGMVAFYDFGPVLEPEGGGGRGDEPPGIEVDNTLGSETPSFDLFIAVVGAKLPGEGVTFVELPAPPAPASDRRGPARDAEHEEIAALRVQLSEAQRRGDLQAIERQELLEKVEQAQDRIAALEEERAESRDAQASTAGVREEREAASAERIDALQTREQSLRWELERLRGELEHARARPVEELEAEVASLQAQLRGAHARIDALEAVEEELGAPGEDELAEAPEHETLVELHLVAREGAPTEAQEREWLRARGKLGHLMRKLERGGRLSALELHRELGVLQRLLS